MSEDQQNIGAYFLGPKSENEYWAREKIQNVLDHWFLWRKSLFPKDAPAIDHKTLASDSYHEKRNNITKHLNELHDLLRAETPKFSPRYIGHMVSEISLPAILGHFSALLHNPNNTSKDSSRIGTLLEQEAIEMLLKLVGYSSVSGTGHFTSGGTVANFEAIWRARFRMDHWLSMSIYLKKTTDLNFDIFKSAHMGWDNFNSLSLKNTIIDEQMRECSLTAGNPWRVANLLLQYSPKGFNGPVLLIPGNKHFSWQKGCNLFGFGEEALWSIPLDKEGKVDCIELEALITKAYNESRPILMIVSVAGTTETGIIDPIHKVQDLLDRLKKDRGWDIWHHIDAAFGGFMATLCHNPEIAKDVITEKQLAALKAMSRSNSITMDPHKLGYIPYACGAFIVPDEQNYTVSQFKAPYLERADITQSKWSSTIEGSRTASGASATWLTGKSIGFDKADFAQIIANTFTACKDFKNSLLNNLDEVYVLSPCNSNVLCFSLANKKESLSSSNKKTLELFEKLSISPNFAISKTTLHRNEYNLLIKQHIQQFSGQIDSDLLILIRCVFMNPFWSNKNIGENLRSEFVKEVKSYLPQINKSVACEESFT